MIAGCGLLGSFKLKFPRSWKCLQLYEFLYEVNTPFLFNKEHRLSPETPAQKAMNYYFENSNSKNFRGRPTTTLPNSLHNDIIRLTNYTHNNKYNFTQLKSIDDMRNLRLLAQDRKKWSTLVKDIYEAAKAERDF